jgi:hypothetical protein
MMTRMTTSEPGRLRAVPPRERRDSGQVRSSTSSVASVGSICSVASVGSIACIASVGSLASIGSVGSVGSIASIGSAGAVLSVGSAGGFGMIGRRPVLERVLASWLRRGAGR